MNLLGCLKRNLKKNNLDTELLNQKRLAEEPIESSSVADQKQIKVEPAGSRLGKVEIATEPIVRQTEEMLGLIMAQQDELQRRQISEAEETELELEAQTVITGLQPRVEKLPAKSRFPQPKRAAKIESSISQDVLPGVSSPTPAKAPGVLLKEKAAEPTLASGKDEKYKPAIPVTEAIVEHQIAPEDSTLLDIPEVTVVTVEIADHSSTDKLPGFFYAGDTGIVSIEEGTIPQPADLIETDVLQNGETVFDDEVMTVFERLVELIDLEKEQAPLATLEPYEAFLQEEIVFLNQEITEPIEKIETNVFAEFIITKPQSEKVPDIETIIEGVNDQTLEETLLQLSFYLTEAVQDFESTGIKAALEEVVESSHIIGTNNANKENKVSITPELTQKLLILLRSVGYDDPQEVLIEFIGQHDFEFLLQATRYLYQLIDDNNRQEFSPIKALNFIAMKIDEPLIVRLGQAIMQYFYMNKIISEL